MPQCWHCQSTDPTKPNGCDCIVCGKEGPKVWTQGECGFCVAIVRNAPLMAKLDHYGIDPRCPEHWVRVGNKAEASHRVFRPIFPGEEA